MILDEALEIHLMNSIEFYSTVEDLSEDKVCCIQKAYVNRDYNLTLYESYEFGIEYEQEEDLMKRRTKNAQRHLQLSLSR
jgi:hypothetical protein